jgi:class 3 adenylate cyclase
MSLTKKQALKAIAAQARRRVGLEYDSKAILSNEEAERYLKSSDPHYRRFADFLLNHLDRRGGHPDYDHLAAPELAGKTEEGTITTLFMDLKNFTKYCCFLSPKAVYQAKAASIETAVGVCRIYGGYLHEIPGDGVMFFFGGKNKDDIDFAKKAINAAADTMDTLENEVMVEYNSNEQFPNIHPKIGVDYGNATWGAYGAQPIFEVKATAFNVDIAHKMMSERLSQEVAVGEDIKNLLKIDEEKYLTTGWRYEKQLTVKGETKKICYETHVFNWQQWLRDKSDENEDLSLIGTLKAPAIVTKSATKLSSSTPLA